MSAGSRGQAAETLACRHLRAAGLVLVERNYRCRRGEIDLVMREADTLVFVEVRYRRQTSHGSAVESVDWRKQSKLSACALHYLQNRTQFTRLNCRFDVLAVNGNDGTIDWIRNAFQARE